MSFTGPITTLITNVINEENKIEFRDKLLLDGSEHYDRVKKKLEEMINDENNYNLVANTNTGKTVALIQCLKENKKKFIFIVPLSILREQLKRYELFTLNDCYLKNLSKNVLPSYFVETYDSFNKLIEFLVKNNESIGEYILVIDEVHNFVNAINYRSEALNKIHANLHRFKKVITITGTYEGVLANDYSTVLFKNVNLTTKEAQHYSYRGDTVFTFLDFFQQKWNKEPAIIFHNNIRNNEILKKKLDDITNYSIENINSENKEETELYKKLKEDSREIDSHLIISTQVLAEGISIEDDKFKQIFLLDIDDMIVWRQMIQRIRSFDGEIFDLQKNRQNSELLEVTSESPLWPSFRSVVNEICSFAEKLKNEISSNVIQRFNMIQNSDLQSEHELIPFRILKDTLTTEIFYQYQTKINEDGNYRDMTFIEVNRYWIHSIALKYFNYIMKTNFSYKRHYLREFANIDLIDNQCYSSFPALKGNENIIALDVIEQYTNTIVCYQYPGILQQKEITDEMIHEQDMQDSSDYLNYAVRDSKVNENLNIFLSLTNLTQIDFAKILMKYYLSNQDNKSSELKKLTKEEIKKFIGNMTMIIRHKFGILLQPQYEPIGEISNVYDLVDDERSSYRDLLLDKILVLLRNPNHKINTENLKEKLKDIAESESKLHNFISAFEKTHILIIWKYYISNCFEKETEVLNSSGRKIYKYKFILDRSKDPVDFLKEKVNKTDLVRLKNSIKIYKNSWETLASQLRSLGEQNPS